MSAAINALAILSLIGFLSSCDRNGDSASDQEQSNPVIEINPRHDGDKTLPVPSGAEDFEMDKEFEELRREVEGDHSKSE
jgi:hypothetical protein